jgi:hypothetical protein
MNLKAIRNKAIKTINEKAAPLIMLGVSKMKVFNSGEHCQIQLAIL